MSVARTLAPDADVSNVKLRYRTHIWILADAARKPSSGFRWDVSSRDCERHSDESASH
jgi:hypothetical protein